MWTLTCGPPGGTHPRPASACRELAAHAGLLRPPSRACPLLLRRNAPQSLVRGRVGTRHVDRLVRPGCDAAWGALYLASDESSYVTGSELDYHDALQDGGFKVKNPNAATSCSCGESFSA